jgi:predicted nuclease of restriction endonuclease-like RecB superfamily
MIRSEHCIVAYDFVNRRVIPDRLLRARDGIYLQAAQECLDIYRSGIGRTRQELHSDVEDRLGTIPGCPPRRVAAFCKLLDDAGQYHESTGKTAALRKRVFALAASLHPIVRQREGIFENQLLDAQAKVAQEIGLSWQEIEDRLFDDVIELQKLSQFPETLVPTTLLSRYNLAQTQAALYRATRLRIDAFEQAPTIIRQAKLAGLMHRIARINSPDVGPASGYRMVLDGPVSSMRESTRYGIGFAKLLPTLLVCRQWSLLADVLGPQNRHFELRLSPADRLSSETVVPADFDSDLERRIAELWHRQPVPGWTFTRDQEFLYEGQQVFTPDFVLTGPRGLKIYIEVVGFWTPQYLHEKHQRLQSFVLNRRVARRHWLLMFDRPPPKTKEDIFDTLHLPSVVVSKTKMPDEWIRIALGEPAD